jgi:hypothetical protein
MLARRCNAVIFSGRVDDLCAAHRRRHQPLAAVERVFFALSVGGGPRTVRVSKPFPCLFILYFSC